MHLTRIYFDKDLISLVRGRQMNPPTERVLNSNVFMVVEGASPKSRIPLFHPYIQETKLKCNALPMRSIGGGSFFTT